MIQATNEVSEAAQPQREDRARALLALLGWAETMRAHDGLEARFSITGNKDGSWDVDTWVHGLPSGEVPHGHGTSRLLARAGADSLADMQRALEEIATR